MKLLPSRVVYMLAGMVGGIMVASAVPNVIASEGSKPPLPLDHLLAFADVFEQIKEFNDHVGGLGHLLMMGQGGYISHADTVANLNLFSREVLPRLAEI